MICSGSIWQHFAGAFSGTVIAVLIFSFFTHDPMIVLGACALFGTLGWFHPQIYTGVCTSKAEIATAWTAYRAREVTIEQKIARLRAAAMTVFAFFAFILSLVALFKIDSVMSPWLPITVWALFLTSHSFLLKQEWTEEPFAEINKLSERAQYERGRVYFFTRKLLEIGWIGSVFAVIVVSQLVFYGFTVVSWFLGGAAMSFVRLVRKMLYNIAKHAECGICITTALGVTVWATRTYLPSAEDPVRAVQIAVLAGFLAAALSIIVSKGIVIFFESDPERKRLATSMIVETVSADVDPQLVRVLNIGWLFFSRQTLGVKRILPAEPRMKPLNTKFIPSLKIG